VVVGDRGLVILQPQVCKSTRGQGAGISRPESERLVAVRQSLLGLTRQRLRKTAVVERYGAVGHESDGLVVILDGTVVLPHGAIILALVVIRVCPALERCSQVIPVDEARLDDGGACLDRLVRMAALVTLLAEVLVILGEHRDADRGR